MSGKLPGPAGPLPEPNELDETDKHGKLERGKTMPLTIELKLFAGLQQFKPERAEAYSIADGTTIRSLLKGLSIPEEKAKLLFVNGIKADLDTVLRGGERVGIFPPVGGG